MSDINVPWVPGFASPVPPAVTGVHAAGTVPTCKTCEAMRERQEEPLDPGTWSGDDEPFGWPRTGDTDQPWLGPEPALKVEAPIVPEIIE